MLTTPIKLDMNRISDVIRKDRPLEYRFHYASFDDMMCVAKIMSELFILLKKDYLSANMKYITQELIQNANKALFKRMYFKKAGLDFGDPGHYEKGMASFACHWHEQEQEYIDALHGTDLDTRLTVQYWDRCLTIKVINAGLPTSEEMKRVQVRLDRCKTVRNSSEVFTLFADETEGAGLGLATSMRLLKKITNNPDSLSPFSFYIDQKRNETIARINIALDTLPEKISEELSDIITTEIASLPGYPENIRKLEEMLDREESSLAKMAEIISHDPTLTAELLKTINSAQYVLPHKVHSIANAVSLVGIRGVRNLLLAFGARTLIEGHYGKQDELWEHAYRCAYYAHTIARENERGTLCDDVYIAGILHDIGEIIVRGAYGGLFVRIDEFCRRKGIQGNFVEQLAIGCSHAKVGAQVLKKWNFPEMIVAAVEFAADARSAPSKWRDIVDIIYMADHLAMLHEKRIARAAIDPEVFSRFGFDTPESIDAYGSRLNERYEEQLHSQG